MIDIKVKARFNDAEENCLKTCSERSVNHSKLTLPGPLQYMQVALVLSQNAAPTKDLGVRHIGSALIKTSIKPCLNIKFQHFIA